MNDGRLDEVANLFLALSDKTRLRMLGMMRYGEVSVGEFSDILGESQPKVSRHLAYLRSMGIVSTRRDGKWIYYRIQVSNSRGIERILKETLDCVASPSVQHMAEANESMDHNIFQQTHTTNPTQGEIDVFLL